MSEPIPESVPTSQDPRSKRPLKRRALTPVSQQASQVDALFAKPDRDINIPSSSALSKTSNLPPPPEIVANVQGSSAGAGSGEFHVYKASRRREYERLKIMDEEVAREEADAEFEKKRSEQKQKDDERTEKNRKKREKQKQKKRTKGKDALMTEAAIADGAGKKSGDANEAGSPREKDEGAKDDTAAPAVGAAAEEVGVVIHDDD